VQAAFSSNLCLITGGPGTGKTRTIAVILALLHRQAERAGAEPPRILLAAPTGKAAIRMTESIRRLLEEFPDSAASLAGDAATLHRLLGLTPDSPLPRYHAAHPLAADLVIVDEASMIDLALMAKLFAAVPATARLILLGDRDQLASVEAGRVLGDICAAALSPGAPTAGAPLPIAMVELRENFRFAAESGIRRLSVRVNAGDAEGALSLLDENRSDDLRSSLLPIPDLLGETLRTRVIAGFRPALEAPTPAEALDALAQFRILSAVREGPFGVVNLNRLTEAALARAGLIALGPRHYRGQPIMVLRNDYNLRLFNGDIGLMLPDETSDGALKAFFRGADGELRRLQPARLPEHETAWAITVHKSQGSEFDRLLFVLPDEDRAILTRELVYTAITRARSGVEIWHRPAILKAAIARRTLRLSGLTDAIRSGGGDGAGRS
jgi:exodeoxyribonuclease V alpha subunit